MFTNILQGCLVGTEVIAYTQWKSAILPTLSSLWQTPVPPVTTTLASWRVSVFSASVSELTLKNMGKIYRYQTNHIATGVHNSWDAVYSQDVIITSSLRQNDAATSFWRYNEVIYTACVHWVVVRSPRLMLTKLEPRQIMRHFAEDIFKCIFVN